MKKEIVLKRCPICGAMPNRRAEDMSGGNYQHYYGCTDYIYECPKCKVLSASRCTVYIDSNEKAEREAQKAWNAECDKYEKLLSWREEESDNKVSSIRYGLEPHYNLDGLADYVAKTPTEQLDREVVALSKSEKEDLVDMLLSSKYNIFNPWYKKLLISINSPRTNDILSYYKKGFDKVKID